MELSLPPGKYVVAVSGGVDSVSLLDLLSKKPDIELIIAHFNHGIRRASAMDERFVGALAKKYGLELEIGHGKLGLETSEELAREARYKFLRGIREKHRAVAIITAHHQDDLIETAFLNILRGTGRRGLSAIADSDIKRPLLGIPRQTLVKYAKRQGLKWREDSSNLDTSYLRNYLRHEILLNLKAEDRLSIIDNIEKVAKTNKTLNQQIATLSHKVKLDDRINRSVFTQLPPEVANELLMHWLRELGIRQFDRKTIDRLNLAIKTAHAGTKHPVLQGTRLEIKQKTAHFSSSD